MQQEDQGWKRACHYKQEQGTNGMVTMGFALLQVTDKRYLFLTVHVCAGLYVYMR